MQEKTVANQEEMKAQVSSYAYRIDVTPGEMTAKLETKIEANQEKMGALISRIDINQTRTETIIAKMDAIGKRCKPYECQARME
jgi:hypothetical protein